MIKHPATTPVNENSNTQSRRDFVAQGGMAVVGATFLTLQGCRPKLDGEELAKIESILQQGEALLDNAHHFRDDPDVFATTLYRTRRDLLLIKDHNPRAEKLVERIDNALRTENVLMEEATQQRWAHLSDFINQQPGVTRTDRHDPVLGRAEFTLSDASNNKRVVEIQFGWSKFANGHTKQPVRVFEETSIQQGGATIKRQNYTDLGDLSKDSPEKMWAVVLKAIDQKSLD